MILPIKKDTLTIRQQVVELYKLEQKYKEISKSYKEKKEKLTTAVKNYMFCNKDCNDDFQFDVGSNSDKQRMLGVKRITPTSIIWDADKLEQNLEKEVAKKVIQKTYTITDMEGLVKYLKSCGVNPKKFKSFLLIEKRVDETALEQLNALGEVASEELEGCYTTSTKCSYLRISLTEEEG